jgi:arabinose-5-phosphate isomerase
MQKPARDQNVNIRQEIDKVFEIEIEALNAIRASISDDFEKAVLAIAGCTGKVVITGLGKSGIIASKIAATLTSTGTTATFLHASEALHGDLGLVNPDDILIAIGKTGETPEINALLPIVKKLGTTIIVITANAKSKMADLADILLPLEIPREACPLNLAPTSSTTASLVVGDAIAVALMKLKQVSKDDFARRHPGGQLGKRLLLKVSDVMRTGPRSPVITVNDSIKNMLIRITEGQAGAISVVDDDHRLIGLVTDYDIRKALEHDQNILESTVARLMNPNPTAVYSDEMAIDALALMQNRRKRTSVLPVTDRDRKVVGMLHLFDLVSAGL